MNHKRNFKVIKRATKSQKFQMTVKAQEYAEENRCIFNEFDTNPYSAEFIDKDGHKFYGWMIESINNNSQIPEYDIVFGSGQMIFSGDYVISNKDYYEYIGAGI